jgi:hypothetical protein
LQTRPTKNSPREADADREKAELTYLREQYEGWARAAENAAVRAQMAPLAVEHRQRERGQIRQPC